MLIYGIIFPRWRVAADVSLGSWKIFRRFFPSLFRPIIASAGRKCYTAPAIIPLLFLSPSLISFKSSFGHSHFLFGLAQALTGYAAWVFERQETFAVRREDDPQIGTNPKRLVVYFSRMGYVRRKAFEEAARTGAEVYEIQSAERTEGTLGFWWCGRYAMHRWPMPIRPVTVDLTAYEHVTICSPIWAFALAAPVRAFCQAASGKIWEADYLLVHFSPASYENAADEMDRLLGLKRTGFRSFVCRTGRFREMPKKPSVHFPA